MGRLLLEQLVLSHLDRTSLTGCVERVRRRPTSMNYNYRYRLKPTESQRETLDYHRDTCRQLYNHALYRFTQIPEDQGIVKQRVRTIRDELPDHKNW